MDNKINEQLSLDVGDAVKKLVLKMFLLLKIQMLLLQHSVGDSKL
jgi:hypothetical protein